MFTIISFFIYLFIYNASGSLTQKSFSNVWILSTLYAKQGWILKFLIFQLSGLPPVFFFLIKFSFLLVLLPHTTFFLIIIVFLNLLLSVFFYLKIFSATNDKTSNIILKEGCADCEINEISKKIHVKRVYKYSYYLILFLFINFFSIFFFLDFYIIVYSFMPI